MPRNARCVEPGLAYHVTQRGTNRERVFFTIADYKLYLDLLRSQLATTRVEVLAYCLMSNHVHLVVVPRAADALGGHTGQSEATPTKICGWGRSVRPR